MPAVFVQYEMDQTTCVVLIWLSGAENSKKALLRMNSVFLQADGIFSGLGNGSLIHGVLFVLKM